MRILTLESIGLPLKYVGVAQLVESLPSKQTVAGSSPVSHSIWFHGPVVMTPACHAGDGGSIPPGTAICRHSTIGSAIDL